MHERKFPEVVDSTMLSTLTCPRKWVWSYERNYTAFGGKSIHLMAGAAFAKALEVMRRSWVDGKIDEEITDANFTPLEGQPPRKIRLSGEVRSASDALHFGLQALMLSYDESVIHDTAKTLDRMCGALEFYADSFPIDNPEFGTVSSISGKPGVEWNFAVPLPVLHPDTGEPIIFCGRLDVILDVFGGVYLTDDKTTSSLGITWPQQWDMRGQFVGYAWAARQYGLRVDGSLVRGISILKTKYDKAQAIVPQPEWKQNEWLASTVSKLEHAKRLYAQAVDYPVFGEPCNEYGGCEFKQPCMNRDHDGWLDSNYVARNWNPLERH
jgi:hypothetical protein